MSKLKDDSTAGKPAPSELRNRVSDRTIGESRSIHAFYGAIGRGWFTVLVCIITLLHTITSSGDTPKLYELQFFQFLNSKGQNKSINIIGATAAHWKEFGTALKFESHQLENIKRNFNSVEDRCYELLRQWLDGHATGDKKLLTWETLLHAMLNVGCTTVAQTVWESLTDEGELAVFTTIVCLL